MGQHRYHPYNKAVKRLARNPFQHLHQAAVKRHKKHHHSATFHGGLTAMEIDSSAADAQKNPHQAGKIPGLGKLEWGFPNSIITTLRYCENLTLTSTTGATTSKVFRANGTFDPNYTDTGHQPMFRDQWAAIYDYYTVLGSKIKVTFKGTSDYSTVVCLQGSGTNSLSSGVNTFLEQNNGVHTIVGNKNCETKQLFMTYSPVENQGQDVKNDGSSMTLVGADPTNGEATYYFGILAATSDAASTSTMDIIVEIEYTVKYTELTKNSGS